MKLTVFYAWQADLPNSSNRRFIGDALERAAARLRADDSAEIHVDQGTVGLSGMPEITTAILRKIDSCAVFVGDLSLVGWVGPELRPKDGGSRPKRLSNSSVMYELGYARHSCGESRVIGLVNTAYGEIEICHSTFEVHALLHTFAMCQLCQETRKLES